jgi:hypothetical protein
VIGNGHGGHLELLGLAEQIAQPDSSIQQAVSGMDMEMDEIRGWHNYSLKHFFGWIRKKSFSPLSLTLSPQRGEGIFVYYYCVTVHIRLGSNAHKENIGLFTRSSFLIGFNLILIGRLRQVLSGETSTSKKSVQRSALSPQLYE